MPWRSRSAERKGKREEVLAKAAKKYCKDSQSFGKKRRIEEREDVFVAQKIDEHG
jgi:hypothetical protein